MRTDRTGANMTTSIDLQRQASSLAHRLTTYLDDLRVLDVPEEEWGNDPGLLELEAELDAMGDAIAGKLDAYAYVVRALDAEAEQIRQDEVRRAARRRSIERRAEALRLRAVGLLRADEDIGGTGKVRGEWSHSIYWSESVTGPELAEKWPKEFQRVKIEADKVAAKKALAKGQEFPGLSLTRNPTWRAR